MKIRLVVAVLLVVPLESAAAQAGRREVDAGNRLFAEGRFDEARDRYLDAVRAAPDSPVARFNAANALYRTDDFQSALSEYQEALALGDSALQAQAWYNLGNALYRQQAFDESLEAFKQSLRLNPGDLDAKHNLERALEHMQQQDQQQQQDRDPSDDQSDSNDDSSDPASNDREPEADGPDPSDADGQRDESSSQERQGPPPHMTPEEVQRLLQAVNEDPNEMRRQAARRARPVRVRRPW